MMSSRHNGPGQARTRPRETGIGLFLGISLALANPAPGVASDSLGVSDTLPPPQTYIAAYVADSATGLPLAGASVTLQNAEANISIASTDGRGWAYVARNGLPSGSPSSDFWVTAGYPGYISRLITLSGCGSDTPTPCVLRNELARATEKNSFVFTGALLDSARKPIAGLPLDVSSLIGGGWITFLSKTNDTGHFVFKDLPNGLKNIPGYLFVRRSRSSFEMLTVSWSTSGGSIMVPRWSTTSLAPSGARPRALARGKPMPSVLLPSPNRDAAGRRRD